MENLNKVLKGVTLLKDMDAKIINVIAEHSSVETYRSREFILRRGEDADFFYIIRHGRVALEISALRRGPLIVKTLSEDDVLGISWIIPPYKYLFDAHAVELTRVIKVDAKVVRSKCDKDSDLCATITRTFIRLIGQRLEDTTLQLLDIYGTRT